MCSFLIYFIRYFFSLNISKVEFKNQRIDLLMILFDKPSIFGPVPSPPPEDDLASYNHKIF